MNFKQSRNRTSTGVEEDLNSYMDFDTKRNKEKQVPLDLKIAIISIDHCVMVRMGN